MEVVKTCQGSGVLLHRLDVLWAGSWPLLTALDQAGERTVPAVRVVSA